jgi:hypothetical protein
MMVEGKCELAAPEVVVEGKSCSEANAAICKKPTFDKAILSKDERRSGATKNR